MKPRPDLIRQQIAAENARTFHSRARAAAAMRLADWAVMLCGYAEPIPIKFNSNEGAWPVWVGTTKMDDLKDYLQKPDSESPLVPVIVLDHVRVPNEIQARALKGELDTLLVGSAGMGRLRYRWRNVYDPRLMWTILLGQALETLNARGVLDAYSEAEREERLRRMARRGR